MSVRASAKIFTGCLGISLVVIGLAIMGIEISRSSSLGEWRATTLFDVVRSPYGQQILPEALTFWLAMPRTFKGFRDVVVWLMEFIPIWLGSLTIGGVILWKSLKS
jgi:hypothetical protein